MLNTKLERPSGGEQVECCGRPLGMLGAGSWRSTSLEVWRGRLLGDSDAGKRWLFLSPRPDTGVETRSGSRRKTGVVGMRMGSDFGTEGVSKGEERISKLESSSVWWSTLLLCVEALHRLMWSGCAAIGL